MRTFLPARSDRYWICRGGVVTSLPAFVDRIGEIESGDLCGED